MDTLARRLGWVVTIHSSKSYQFGQGESVQGFEFKLDDRCTETSRLSIEVAEKSRKDIPVWTNSGIFRGDNTIFYVHGNHQSFWIFAKKHLRAWFKKFEPEVVSKFGTIKTFYMPVSVADSVCIHRLDID